jgi:phosphatidylserine decarboxylase
LAGLAALYLFWRYYWFWRNPRRVVPRGEHYVSPADGTVVYVLRAPPHEPVIVYKRGQAATINDIVREELHLPKILIGIFMSPFGVHYNRAPLAGTLTYKREYPAQGKNWHMGSMHWRSMLQRLPIYGNSPHIVQNNRAVTRFCGVLRGQEVACYVVQIGGGSVHGIDVYPEAGQAVEQGEVFGMIRIGSQVDLIVPDLPGLEVKVAPGDRVVAGETILIA